MVGLADTAVVPRQHLARELRRLREEQARLSLDEVAQKMRWTRTTLWHVECGYACPDPRAVAALCALYGADEHVTACLFAIAIAIATHTRTRTGWQDHQTQTPGALGVYRELREHADRIMEYQPTLVPILLQASAYARIQLAETTSDPDTLDQRVAARLASAQLLTRTEPDPPQLTVVLDEAVIRQLPHRPDIMNEQLRRLAEVGGLPNVRIRIVPFTAGPHPGLLMISSFSVLDFPDRHQQDALTPPKFTEAGDLDDNAESQRYVAVSDDLLALALDEEATRDLLLRTAGHTGDRHGPQGPAPHGDRSRRGDRSRWSWRRTSPPSARRWVSRARVVDQQDLAG